MYDEKCLQQLGNNIKFLRAACQLSQRELAKRIGISQTHLSNIEHCHVKINLKLLLRIANAFGCTMEKISLMPEHFQSRRKPKPPVQRRIRLADRKFICGKKCSRFCRCCIYIKIERHKQKKRLSVKE